MNTTTPTPSASDSQQLVWDFDANEPEPGSTAWITALRPTDADAMRLQTVDMRTLDAERAARLWAKVAAWVESDQIAYYIDDAPASSDAAYDARMRCLEALQEAFPALDTIQSPTHRVGGTFSNDFASVRHPSRMMSLDDVFSIDELRDCMTVYDVILTGRNRARCQ